MSTRSHTRKIGYTSLPLLALTLFCVGAYAEEKTAEHSHDSAKLPSYTKAIKANSFQSIKYSKSLKVKGWRFSDDVYMGGVKVAGEYGPGMLIDKGRYVWGFNHERIEFQFRF